MKLFAKRKLLWIYWAALTLAAAAYLTAGLVNPAAGNSPWLSPARALFLPGQTSHGHYQIELKCETCHGGAFGGKEAIQDACINCHGAALKEANDSHPPSKFTDPRNADRVAKLDAAYCATCHVEHRPEITRAMGVTLPADFCFNCHGSENDVAKERPSHKGMAFTTCANAGCHNFHDNRALYEDFLVKHLHEPDQLDKRELPPRDFRKVIEDLSDYPIKKYPLRPLAADQRDAPPSLNADPAIVNDWVGTAHAKAGVNCSACHQANDAKGAVGWVQHPDQQACRTCHDPESKGFAAGRHGMRIEQKLPPMSPAFARIPMKADAGDKKLGCTSCHGAHRFDVRTAAVESCLGCHDDSHSRAYKTSPHYALWQKEARGEAPAGTGVSCASCHLPRVSFRTPDDVARMLVQHNQNGTLRPNEKMIRPVCMNCHGLGFSIDALADGALIASNFKGRPARHIASLDMAEKDQQRPRRGKHREEEK